MLSNVYNKNGKAVRAFKVIEVQPNGHEIEKACWNPAEKEFAQLQCQKANEEGNVSGVEYYVKTCYFG